MPQPSGDRTSFGFNGIIPVRRIQYGDSQPVQSAPIAIPAVDPHLLSSAIRNNETGGLKNPYSFSRYSGSSTDGNANGAYQVTDAELASYGPRYLGKPVTPQQFLANPAIQDQYMAVKASALASRGLTPEQIMAVHRGGGSDLTASALQSLVQRYQPYVQKGMQFYNKPAATTSRSIQDLTRK